MVLLNYCSENPLQPVPKTLSQVLQTVFQTLDHVILGKVKYDWEEVIRASAMWDNISNLQVKLELFIVMC